MVNESIGPAGPGGPESLGEQQGRDQTRKSEQIDKFKELLNSKIGDVNDLQFEADKLVADLVKGKTDNVHEVLVAVNEADLSFRLMMEVRNKLVEAYEEVMRMQI